MDPDPSITYSGDVTDVGNPSTFSFVFQQAIVATAAPGVVTHQYLARTTDGGTDGVVVTPYSPPDLIPVDSDGRAEIAVYTLSTNGGFSFLNAGLDLDPGATHGSGTQAEGPFSETGTGPAATGSYNLMRVDVVFVLGGGDDQYSFNGLAIVEEGGRTACANPRTGFEPSPLCATNCCLTLNPTGTSIAPPAGFCVDQMMCAPPVSLLACSSGRSGTFTCEPRCAPAEPGGTGGCCLTFQQHVAGLCVPQSNCGPCP